MSEITEEQFDAYYFAPIREKFPKLRADHPGSRFIEEFIKDAEGIMLSFKEAGYPVHNSMGHDSRTCYAETTMSKLQCQMRHA